MPVAANQIGPDYATARELARQNICKPEGVPISYQLQAAKIAELWPEFLKDTKARGLTNENTDQLKLWLDYAHLVYDRLETVLTQAESDAMAKIEAAGQRPIKAAPNAAELTAVDRQIISQLGITEEQYRASPGAERREAKLATNASPAEVIADAFKYAASLRAQARGEDGLTAAERDACRPLGVAAEQFLAEPAQRQR